MAKAIGKTASGIWWLVGLVVAIIFGRAGGQRCTPKYGVRPYPQPIRTLTQSQKETAEKDRARAEKLVNEYLSPTGTAPEPAAKAEVKALIAKFGASFYKVRDAATNRIVEIGPLALPALRKILEHEDPEVAHRAQLAIEGIEKSARASTLAALRKIPLATRLVLEKRMPELAKEFAETTKAYNQAADKDQNRQTKRAMEAAQARTIMAQTLYFQVALGGKRIIGLPQPAYGVVQGFRP